MAKFSTELNPSMRNFLAEQKIFFTATAPSQGGRVNLSPKGMDTFCILDNNKVAYLDLTGSGNETSCHVKDNGRMTIMFCSFTDQPLILRLYGKGEIITPQHPQWRNHLTHFSELPGTRQIILLHIESVLSSCGFSVPYFKYEGERDDLLRWSDKKGEDGIRQYWVDKNQESIDGLPAYPLLIDAND